MITKTATGNDVVYTNNKILFIDWEKRDLDFPSHGEKRENVDKFNMCKMSRTSCHTIPSQKILRLTHKNAHKEGTFWEIVCLDKTLISLL